MATSVSLCLCGCVSPPIKKCVGRSDSGERAAVTGRLSAVGRRRAPHPDPLPLSLTTRHISTTGGNSATEAQRHRGGHLLLCRQRDSRQQNEMLFILLHCPTLIRPQARQVELASV